MLYVESILAVFAVLSMTPSENTFESALGITDISWKGLILNILDSVGQI